MSELLPPGENPHRSDYDPAALLETAPGVFVASADATLADVQAARDLAQSRLEALRTEIRRRRAVADELRSEEDVTQTQALLDDPAQ